MEANKKNRWTIFGFRVTQDEREKIRILAEKLRRNESDAVRITIIEKVEQLEKETQPSG